jgi:hypothetical protein
MEKEKTLQSIKYGLKSIKRAYDTGGLKQNRKKWPLKWK